MYYVPRHIPIGSFPEVVSPGSAILSAIHRNPVFKGHAVSVKVYDGGSIANMPGEIGIYGDLKHQVFDHDMPTQPSGYGF